MKLLSKSFLKEICDQAAKKIQAISNRVEEAVCDVLDTLKSTHVTLKAQSQIKDPSVVPCNESHEHKVAREKMLHREHDLEEETKELANYFNNKLVDSLLRCIRNSLDAIKRRVFPAYVL